MAHFAAATLDALRAVREVEIRTEKHPKSAVVIWVVVAGDEVFVRSWQGTRGRWYRDLARGGLASLEFDGNQLAVQAIPEPGDEVIAKASEEFLTKYQPSAHAMEMVRPEILPTTLRLVPAGSGGAA